MDNTRDRLIGCFQTVFQDVPTQEILSASQESLPAWDSVAAISLVNVIEDEFGIQMDFDEIANLDTFDRVYQYLLKEEQAS